jgi:hypothetical protein
MTKITKIIITSVAILIFLFVLLIIGFKLLIVQKIENSTLSNYALIGTLKEGDKFEVDDSVAPNFSIKHACRSGLEASGIPFVNCSCYVCTKSDGN